MRRQINGKLIEHAVGRLLRSLFAFSFFLCDWVSADPNIDVRGHFDRDGGGSLFSREQSKKVNSAQGDQWEVPGPEYPEEPRMPSTTMESRASSRVAPQNEETLVQRALRLVEEVKQISPEPAKPPETVPDAAMVEKRASKRREETDQLKQIIKGFGTD